MASRSPRGLVAVSAPLLLWSLALLLLLLLGAAPRATAQSGPGWQLYSFCYVIEQTWATSPYLAWSILTSGTLNVSTSSNGTYWSTAAAQAGYQVLDARGTRTIVAQGKAPSSVSILGVAAQNSYGWNDNLLTNVTAAPFLTSYHSIAFTTSSVPLHAGGQSYTAANPGGQSYVALQNFTAPKANGWGVQELDNPLNDGVVSNITSFFYLAPVSSGGLSATFICPYQPAIINYNAAAVAAYQQQVSWTFCWSFTSSEWSLANGLFTESVSGTLNTTGYTGTTINGRPGSLITSLQGTRSYSLLDVAAYDNAAQNSPVMLGWVNAATQTFQTTFLGKTSTGTSQTGLGQYYANNVLYTSYPYMDTSGFMLQAANNQSFIIDGEWDYTNLTVNESAITSHTTAIRMFMTASSILTEWILDETTRTSPFVNRDGFMVITPSVNFTSLGQTLTTWSNAQCSLTAPTVTTYQFCYFLDYQNAATNPGIVTAYGTFTASGPSLRNGRQGLLLQSMNGIRTVTRTGGPLPLGSVSQNIVALKAIDEDSDNWWAGSSDYNDNILYTTAPYVDGDGLLISLGVNAAFLNFTEGGGSFLTSDLKLYSTNYIAALTAGLAPQYEEAEGNAGTPNIINATSSSFQYAPYNASNPTPLNTCGAIDSAVSAPPTLSTYSFCFFKSGSAPVLYSLANSSFLNLPPAPFSYNMTVAGYLTAYNTPIVNATGDRRSGYLVSTMSGVRQYVDTQGWLSSNAIVGPASNYYGSTDGYYTGFVGQFDNLIYTTQPYVDVNGLLYQYSTTSTAYNVYGPLPFAPISVLQWSGNASTAYDAQELIDIVYFSPDVWYCYWPEYNGAVMVVQDNGVSGMAGTVAQQYCNAPPTMQFAFCYVITNGYATSPYGPWQVVVSGVLTVSTSWTQGEYGPNRTSTSYGYQVLNATGTRTLTYRGQAFTNRIVAVAPLNAYNFNDNIINLGSPVFDNARHSLAFQLDGPAMFASGLGYGNFVSVNNWTKPYTLGMGFNEYEQPVNDGITHVITSAWSMQLLNATNANCPLPISAIPTIPAASLALFSQTQSFSFCWSHTGGPGGYGTLDGGNWTITSSGVLTTTMYNGTTTDGRTAYLVVNVTGTRTYTFENGSTQVVQLVGVAPPPAAISSLLPASYVSSFTTTSSGSFIANNVFYPTFPYFDDWGLNIMGATQFDEEEVVNSGLAIGGAGSTNIVRVFITPVYFDFQEWLNDFVTNYVYYNHAGASVIVPYTGTAPATFAAQCAWYSSAITTYQFCYYLDNSVLPAGVAASYKGVTSAYGTLTASGPYTREGRTGVLQLQSINGVRTVLRIGATSNTTIVQNIINLMYPNSDIASAAAGGSINNNWLFPTFPYVDGAGIAYQLSSNGVYPQGTQADRDMWLQQRNTTGYSEANAVATKSGLSYPTMNFFFATALYNASNPQPLSTCALRNSLVAYPAAVLTYSFCYYTLPSASNYTLWLQGTLQVYNVSVASPVNASVFGQPLAGIAGTRVYADNNGSNSVAVITGLSSNYIGGAEGFRGLSPFLVPPSQLVFPGQSSLFDEEGILYQYSGSAFSNGQQVTAAPLGRLFYDSTAGYNLGYTEQVITGITLVNVSNVTNAYYAASFQVSDGAQGAIINAVLLPNGTASVVADGGVSASTGTAITSQCKAPVTGERFSFCYQITNTLQTSPWLTWQVYVSGWMWISPIYTSGEYGSNPNETIYWANGIVSSAFQVINMTGTRTVQFQGKTSTQQIIGVAPINGYNYNDNIIKLSAPYVDTTQVSGGGHSLSYVLSGPAAFADGFIRTPGAVNSSYVNMNGYAYYPPAGGYITESDLPSNDGISQSLVSSMELRFDPTGINTCRLSLAAYTAPTSTQLAAFNSPGPVYAFCYQNTGGPGGYGTVDGGAWQTVVAGVMTMYGYAGTTLGSSSLPARPAYLVAAVNGTRTYTFENGSTQVAVLTGLGSVNAMGAQQLPGGQSTDWWGSYYFYGNNVVYPTFPYFDTFGVILQANQLLDEEGEPGVNPEGVSFQNAVRALTTTSGYMREYMWDPPTNYIWTNLGGVEVFVPYTGQAMPAFGAQQCNYNAGAPTLLSYCYWQSGTSNGVPYVTYTYGVASATGPVQRSGRLGYTIQAMSGVRAFLNGTGPAFVQNVMNVQYIYEDGSVNDNVLYTSYPQLDGIGLVLTLNPYPLGNAATYGVALTTLRGPSSDVHVYYSGYNAYTGALTALTEAATAGGSVSSIVSNVTVSVWTPGSPMQACVNSPASVPTPPALQTYSFCYSTTVVGNGGAQWKIGTSGAITVYGTAIAQGGRTGYAVQNITGTRSTLNPNGTLSSVSITAPSGDWIAAQQGWIMDQLFFPTAPYFSAQGLLYKISGNAATANGTLGGTIYTSLGYLPVDNVIKMFYTPSSSFGEEIYLASGANFSNLVYSGNPLVAATLDGGASANTILLSSCGVSFAVSSSSAAAAGATSAPTIAPTTRASTSTPASTPTSTLTSAPARAPTSAPTSAPNGAPTSAANAPTSAMASTAVIAPTPTSSSTGGPAVGGGGSSGLSHGAIAGIVIGAVLGAALLCLLCFLLLLGARKSAKDGAGGAAKGEDHATAEVSKVGQSQVELAHVGGLESSRIGEAGRAGEEDDTLEA